MTPDHANNMIIDSSEFVFFTKNVQFILRRYIKIRFFDRLKDSLILILAVVLAEVGAW